LVRALNHPNLTKPCERQQKRNTEGVSEGEAPLSSGEKGPICGAGVGHPAQQATQQ